MIVINNKHLKTTHMNENERVKVLRDFLKLSQGDFASKVGMGISSISNIEKLRNVPSGRTMRKISDATGCSYEWLVSGTGEMMEEINSIEAGESKNWKGEAYGQLQNRVEELQSQVAFLRSALSKQMGLEGNFNNTFGLVGFWDIPKSVGSVSLSNVA